MKRVTLSPYSNDFNNLGIHNPVSAGNQNNQITTKLWTDNCAFEKIYIRQPKTTVHIIDYLQNKVINHYRFRILQVVSQLSNSCIATASTTNYNYSY